MQVCMGGHGGEGVQRWWTEAKSGLDGRERPINSVQESTAAPISNQIRPSQPASSFITTLLESHHGYPHPVSLVPPGVPTSISWPLHGRTSHWLANDVAILLVLPLDAPFVYALVQLARQWTQWGRVQFTCVIKIITSWELRTNVSVLWPFVCEVWINDHQSQNLHWYHECLCNFQVPVLH